MHQVIEDVLQFQRQWTSKNTPEMRERGLRIRGAGPAWFRERLEDLTAASGIPDLAAMGRDATGPKSEIPWFRFYSLTGSPSATQGWYVVVLFHAAGRQAYLSLNQGTTTWTGEDFKARPPAELAARIVWARQMLADLLPLRPDLTTAIDLGSTRPLALGYELGNVVAFEYAVDQVPTEQQLHADSVFMARLLGRLTSTEAQQFVPGDRSPEVLEALEASEDAAGRSRAARRRRYRLSKAERDAIERCAVQHAMALYEARDWIVKDVGAKRSYDLHCTRGAEVLRVEVKGTTSTGAEVVLTKNEVAEHRDAHPANALVVVHSIKLIRGEGEPVATGGTIVEWSPWEIADDALSAISYAYKTGL